MAAPDIGTDQQRKSGRKVRRLSRRGRKGVGGLTGGGENWGSRYKAAATKRKAHGPGGSSSSFEATNRNWECDASLKVGFDDLVF